MLDNIKQTDPATVVPQSQQLPSPYRPSELAMENNDQLITSQLSEYLSKQWICSVQLSPEDDFMWSWSSSSGKLIQVHMKRTPPIIPNQTSRCLNHIFQSVSTSLSTRFNRLSQHSQSGCRHRAIVNVPIFKKQWMPFSPSFAANLPDHLTVFSKFSAN